MDSVTQNVYNIDFPLSLMISWRSSSIEIIVLSKCTKMRSVSVGIIIIFIFIFLSFYTNVDYNNPQVPLIITNMKNTISRSVTINKNKLSQIKDNLFVFSKTLATTPRLQIGKTYIP